MTSKTDFTDMLYSNKVPREKVYRDEYPLYPASDDIYNKSLQEEDIDPENIDQLKTKNEAELNESEDAKVVNTMVSITELDIPGSELDDQQEEIGSEDEENNYYSIGGDNHNNLEEDPED